MSNRYFDALAHLDDKRVTSPIDYLKRAAKNGVHYILNTGVNPQQESSIQPLSILQTKGIPTLLSAFGLHPSHANTMDANRLLPTLEERISTSPYPCVALGEIGLDRRLNQPALETQLRVFTLQLEFTKAHGLPFIIHGVKSTQIMLETLTKLGPYPRGGMWHSFGGPS
ncbi:MAG: TatD family hydrolase, partial [Myxococcota bacterium]|nr:TatD family hydrolase [Myxococcota bacterium]